ncbi:hypothetical protein AB0O64_35665 [Streptomyces sp. NPDC088341]|uniref:hypothetical protein n=1 Tax=Streptomyces sp. NPDC088341 TaxID=3154870 RepID=UPI0034313A4D
MLRLPALPAFASRSDRIALFRESYSYTGKPYTTARGASGKAKPKSGTQASFEPGHWDAADYLEGPVGVLGEPPTQQLCRR